MPDWFSIKDKVALITGGSRGIGEMIAQGFLMHGARIYISSRKAEACHAKAAQLAEATGGYCAAIPADCSRLEGIEHVVSKIAEVEPQLDILVNNAGASWGAPLERFPELGFDKVMDINVKGIFFMVQKCLPLLRAAASEEDPARIINIGSVDGIKTPSFENYSYGPSKAAVHHLTRQLGARLVREHIVMNAIAPGPFPSWMLSTGVGGGGDVANTDWTAVARANPRGRLGTMEDIAGLAIFLSSRAGAYTVGETITCDGGSVAAS